MSTTLTLFDTKTRKKEPIHPSDGHCVRMYTCGPTVYNYAHIGNLRTYVFEDLLRRTIQFMGMKIKQVMNLTDVDDKTIRGAVEQGCSLDAFTKKYKEAFFEDLKSLNIQPAEEYPAATDYIPEMIHFIEKLVDKGYAYVGSDQSVYFAISKFKHYGQLSHLKLDELQVGASERIHNDEYDKDNVADFVLWKAYQEDRDGNIYWESPWGKGRPGWHLECSTMAMEILGETIDIHCGGVDNIFPHHENEIAQSECCSGHTFSRHWVHSEHLIVENKKMSKSLGNFFTLRDLLNKGYTGPELRLMLLQTHYRTQLNFTMEGLNGARSSLKRLQEFIFRLNAIEQATSSHAAIKLIERANRQFTQALADDLNISVALAALFDLLRDVNTLCDKQDLSREEAKLILSALNHMNGVLGVLSFEEENETVPKVLEQALEDRENARKNKDWAEADRLRDLITGQGYSIVDTPTGPRLKKDKVKV